MPSETLDQTKPTVRRRSSVWLIALALVALLGSAACSKTDDTTDGNSSSGGTAAPSGTTADEKDDAGMSAKDESGDDDHADGADDDHGDDADSDDQSASGNVTPGNEDFCETLKRVVTELDEAEQTMSTATDASAMQEFMKQMTAAYDELLDAAPDEIKDDIQLFRDALASGNGANFDSPEMRAAGDRLDAWAPANCGFNPDDL